MAKIQNKPHLTNFIKQNYIWILMIVTMSCIHLLYMYLIGARKQDLVYAAVLDAILLLITVLVGFFRYSSKVKALSNALKRPVEEQAQLPEATDDVEILYHGLLENQSIARSESESSAAIRQSQMRDYYSMWVHQIKTPISAMKLLLEAEREELGQLICDDEQSQCQTADRTGGNIGAAGLNAALKQQAALTELSDNVACIYAGTDTFKCHKIYTAWGCYNRNCRGKRPVFYYNKGYRNRNQSRGSATCF